MNTICRAERGRGAALGLASSAQQALFPIFSAWARSALTAKWAARLEDAERWRAEADRRRATKLHLQTEATVRLMASMASQSSLAVAVMAWAGLCRVSALEAAGRAQLEAAERERALLQRQHEESLRSHGSRRELSERELRAQEERQRASFQRAAAAFSAGTQRGLRRCCLVAWAQAARGGRREKEARMGVAAQAAVRLLGASASSLVGLCLGAWRRECAARHQARHQEAAAAARREHELRARRIFESALGSLSLSAGRALRASCFAAWRGGVGGERARRQTEELEGRRRQERSLQLLARMCGSDARATRRLCLSAWAKQREASRWAEADAELRRLAAKERSRLEGVAGCLAMSSAKAVRRSCLCAWRAAARHARERLQGALRCFALSSGDAAAKRLLCFRAWRDERHRAAARGDWRRQSAAARRALARVCGLQDSGLARMCVGAWRGAVQRLRQVAAAELSALAAFCEAEAEAFLRAAVSAWAGQVAAARRLREQLRGRDARAGSRGAVAAALGSAMEHLSSATSATFLRLIIARWAREAAQALLEDADAELHRLKELGFRRCERALGCAFQSSRRLRQKACFFAWLAAARDGVERRHTLESERVKQSAVAAKMLARMIEMEAGTSLRMCWAAWHKVATGARKAAIDAERAHLHAQRNKQLECALGCMARSSGRARRGACWVVWREAAQASKAAREAAVQDRAGRSSTAARMLSALCETGAATTLRMCLTAWAAVAAERRQEAIDAEQHRLMAAKSKQFEHALGCMSRSSERVQRRSCFTAWLREVRAGKERSEKSLREMAQRSAMAAQAVAKYSYE